MENYIDSAIQSVLSQQTAISFELIIVNDGSTDNTKELLHDYENLDCIKIINQSNQGFSGARNTGLNMADGVYVMFLDADDRLLPDAIENLMQVALRNNADVVEGSYIKKYHNGLTKPGRVHKDIKINPIGNMTGVFWGKVFRTALFEDIDIPEGYWFEDSLLAQIMWHRCNNAFTISNYVYEYLRNDKGITAVSKRKLKAIDSFYITRQLLQDKQRAGLTLGQDEYEYFIHMVELTYYRTRFLNESVRRSIFLLQCGLYRKYYTGFSTKNKNYKRRIEKAIKEKNYQAYLLNCELRI